MITDVRGVVLPDTMAVSKPEVPMVATEVVPLVQVPPVNVLVSVVVAPWHKAVEPPIAEGEGNTVTVVVAAQPVAGIV